MPKQETYHRHRSNSGSHTSKMFQQVPKSRRGSTQTVNVHVEIDNKEDCLVGCFKALAGCFKKGS